MNIANLAGSFVTALCCAVLAAIPSDEQPGPEGPVVAYLGESTLANDGGYRRFGAALRQGRAAQQRIELRHVAVATATDQGLADAFERALQWQPTVVVAMSGDAARIASMRHHGRTALVFASYLDPVRSGIVTSLRTRSAAVTGVSLADWLHAKRLELLHEAFPHVRKVGVLVDRSWLAGFDGGTLLGRAAAARGLSVHVAQAETAAEAADALASSGRLGIEAWYIPTTYVAEVAEAAIIDQLRRLNLPAMHTSEAEVERGALLAYSQEAGDVYPVLADLAARICAGEFAGSIPIERPLRHRLTARFHGVPAALRVAPAVLRRADRVL